MKIRIVGFLILSLFMPTAVGVGQVSISGSLRERVSDSRFAALAGATVRISSAATTATQSAISDGEGNYLFARLAPGRYMLTVEKEGFKRVQRDNLILAVNEHAVADVALEVGAVNETINIEAGVSVVQSQSVEIFGLVNERRVKELPLNGRNFIKLVQLAPGVGSQGASNNPAISGSRPVTNSYVVDGIGSNDERLNTGFVGVNGSNTDLGANVPNLISNEAVQEFRIITANADATFGRGSGGQINIVTRSGTNDWHGSAFHYLRHDALDAADFFYKANPNPQFRNEDGSACTPPFKQNLFGGALGGWSLTGLAVLRSGEPFTVTRGIDFNDDGDATGDRPALISGSLSDLYAGSRLGRIQYLLPQAEALTRLTTPQTVDPAAMIARNALRAPSIYFYDVSLLKRFALREALRLTFEANFFNVFNRANFGAPAATLTNPRFGQILNAAAGTNPRQIQFGLRLDF